MRMPVSLISMFKLRYRDSELLAPCNGLHRSREDRYPCVKPRLTTWSTLRQYLRALLCVSLYSLLLFQQGAVAATSISHAYREGTTEDLAGKWVGQLVPTTGNRTPVPLSITFDGVQQVVVQEDTRRHGTYHFVQSVALAGPLDIVIALLDPVDTLTLTGIVREANHLTAYVTQNSALPGVTYQVHLLRRTRAVDPNDMKPVDLYDAHDPSEVLRAYDMTPPIDPAMLSDGDFVAAKQFAEDLFKEIPKAVPGIGLDFVSVTIDGTEVNLVYRNRDADTIASDVAHNSQLLTWLDTMKHMYFADDVTIKPEILPADATPGQPLDGYAYPHTLKPEFLHNGKIDFVRVRDQIMAAIQDTPGARPPFEFDPTTEVDNGGIWRIATKLRLVPINNPAYVYWDQVILTVRQQEDGTVQVHVEVSAWKRLTVDRVPIRIDNAETWTGAAVDANAVAAPRPYRRIGPVQSLYQRCLNNAIAAIEKPL